MTRAYFCFRSILSLSHLFVAILIHKMLLQRCQEDIKRNSSGRTVIQVSLGALSVLSELDRLDRSRRK